MTLWSERAQQYAMQQARGVRQIEFVREIMSGETVPVELKWKPVARQWLAQLVYGKTKLENRSFQNLKNRLVALGFILHIEKEDRPGAQMMVVRGVQFLEPEKLP